MFGEFLIQIARGIWRQRQPDIHCVTIGFLVIKFFHAYAQKNTIFHVESLDQQSVNATGSPLVTRKQLLLVLNCNSHLSCPFV